MVASGRPSGSAGYDAAVYLLGGDPDAIASSAARWSAFSAAAADAAQDLAGLGTDEFSGDEADGFREQLDGHLAIRLRTSAEAWGVVSSALSRFGASLADCQARLRPLRVRADDAAAAGQAEQLSTLRSAALEVHGDHRAAVTRCTADIRRAAGMRFAEPPGWFGRLIGAAGDWIADHAPVLKAISAVLKQVSSLAGMLAMIPALAPIMTPIAVVAGAGAVGVDAAVMVATGRGSVVDLVLDASAMLPGARAAVAVGAAQTAAAADRAAQGDGSWTDVLTVAASAVMGAKGARGRPRAPRSRVRDEAAGPAATGTGEPRIHEPEPASQYGDAGTTASTPAEADAAATMPGRSAAGEPKGAATDGSHADGAGPPTDLPDNLPPGTEDLYRAGASKVPPEWGPPIATDKGVGLRWFGPNPKENGLRIDAGNPRSPYPTQQVDHVIVRSNGNPLMPDGTPIPKSIQDNWQCHIPLVDWVRWSEWNKP